MHENRFCFLNIFTVLGDPGDLDGKESACMLKKKKRKKERICLQCGRPGFNPQVRFHPWVRKVFWRRKWQPTPVLLLGKSNGRNSLVGYSPRDHRESDTTKWLTLTHLTKHSYGIWSSLVRIFRLLWGKIFDLSPKQRLPHKSTVQKKKKRGIISQDVCKTNLNSPKPAIQRKSQSWLIIHMGHMAQELLTWTLCVLFDSSLISLALITMKNPRKSELGR